MFEDFTSCAVCQYNNGEKCELFGRVIGMHGCQNGEERKPRNNFERLKSMSVEEMADWLVMNGCGCDYKTWLNWLKEEIADG